MNEQDPLKEAFGDYDAVAAVREERQRTPGSAVVPVTDGTPAACRQKNAAEFLAGHVPGVMAQYASGMFGAQQHTHSAQPAPDDESGVIHLAEWREEAEY